MTLSVNLRNDKKEYKMYISKIFQLVDYLLLIWF